MEQTQKNITGYYLIDYENVHQTGLNGIEKLTENDKLVIFYTENAETLTFSLYEKLVQCKAEIQLYKVRCGGKNALDFQLATFLGYILGNNPDTECHIISNDKGYEYVRSFWKEKNVKINISSDIAGNVQKLLPVVVPAVQPAPAVKTETDFDIAVKPLNLSEENKSALLKIYSDSASMKNSSKRKQFVCNKIMQKFGNSKVSRYYQAIKPLIK